MKTRTLLAGALLIAVTSPLAAQKDLSGTWVLNISKSTFGGQPAPVYDTARIIRVGSVYRVDQSGDFGPQAGGPQRSSYKWPAGDGEATSDLPRGATIHVLNRQRGDTATFSAEIMVQGQTVLVQTGRGYLTQKGKVMIREMDLLPTQNQSAGSVHMMLLYDRR